MSKWNRKNGEQSSYIDLGSDSDVIFGNGQELWMAFKMYMDWANENPLLQTDFVGATATKVTRELKRMLSISGFKRWLIQEQNVPVKSVYYYFNSKTDELKEISSIMTEIVAEDQISSAMVGIFNSNLTARINKLSERSEVVEFKEQPLFEPVEKPKKVESEKIEEAEVVIPEKIGLSSGGDA